jgi:Carbonic anhydrase
VTLKILPSKLRIEYSRENANLDPLLLRPPHADFAHNWNGYISAVHIDIKIPSEHTVCGKRFAGEYQIYFYHANRKQPIVQSVLMEIHPNERPHLHFQKALNEWQVLFDERKMTCLDKIRKEKEAEEIFKRRMENFLMTGMDSHEVSSSSSSSSSLDNVHDATIYVTNEKDLNEDKDFDYSTILDEPQEERKRFQKRLKNLRKRASHPVFEEQEYEHDPLDHVRHLRSIITTATSTGSNSATNSSTNMLSTSSTANLTIAECIDSTDTFVFQSMSFTCEDINDPSNLSLCTSDNDTTARFMCPVTCGVCSTALNATSSFAPSPSPIPSRTNSPTSRAKWNPFQPRILNSIYFYGYGGSLTEPPCSEWVAWRVLDVPMQISTMQYNQMRDILFHQMDGDCKRTSVHWNGSVARPTQSLNDRPLWRCTREDYLSDVEKQRVFQPL